MPSVCIAHTHLGHAPRGNQTTSERWEGILHGLGWDVTSQPEWHDTPCDVLIALHAEKSHPSIQRFRAKHPHKPLVVAAAGTDIYNDEGASSMVHESFRLATRILVLQPLALREIPEAQRDRGRVIYQSQAPLGEPRPALPPAQGFEVAFLANARAVKDPLTALRAARLLPADSPLRILHLGSSMDTELGAQLMAEAEGVPGFVPLGSLPRSEALAWLERCPLALSTSRHEGGANVVTEALALGTPLLVSAIPGSLGLLGEDYPGRFPVGDAEQLAALLQRAVDEPNFLADLQRACQARAHIAAPELERESIRQLMAELCP